MSFDLSTVTAVGFDLDHALARYHLPEFQSLLHQIIATELLKRVPSASRWIKPNVAYTRIAVKGLVYDRTFGNMLHLSSDCTILIAYHGHTRLSSDSQIQFYGIDRKFTFSERDKSSYYKLDTYFEMAVTDILLDWVEYIDHYPHLAHETYSSVMAHIYSIYDLIYDDVDNSPLFKAMKGNMSTYLQPRPNLHNWLRKTQKKTFIISNSRWVYSNMVCEYIFGEYWYELIDVIICKAQKPNFFDPTNTSPFVVPSSATLCSDVFEGGNVTQLINSFLSAEDVVLFFEDSLSGGQAVKKHTNWKVGMVVEELSNDTPSPYFELAISKIRPRYWYSEVQRVADIQIDCLEKLPEEMRSKL